MTNLKFSAAILADFPKDSLKRSALTSSAKNLSVLTKLENSLGTNLSQFSTLIF